MIHISYKQEKHELKIKGHADYDQKGRDIICAGVSVLFYTLGNTLINAPKTWFSKQPEMADSLTSETGVTYIKCRPASGYEQYIELIYETIVTGLELMFTTYPDYIDLKVTRK